MEMTALEYLREKARMTENCRIEYQECPIVNRYDCVCAEYDNPQAAIAIVRKWAQEHSRKTILQDFLEKYPNAILDKNGVPQYFCPYSLGLIEVRECTYDCKQCWNRPVEVETC